MIAPAGTSSKKRHGNHMIIWSSLLTHIDGLLYGRHTVFDIHYLNYSKSVRNSITYFRNTYFTKKKCLKSYDTVSAIVMSSKQNLSKVKHDLHRTQ